MAMAMAVGASVDVSSGLRRVVGAVGLRRGRGFGSSVSGFLFVFPL